MALDDDTRAWTGGGDWEPYEPPPSPPRNTENPRGAAKPASDPSPPPPEDIVHPGRAGTAIVPGRFDPPHRGHQLLIDFAQRSAETVTIVMFTGAGDRVPSALREAWLRATFPSLRVVLVTSSDELDGVLGARPEVVYSSEANGAELAAKLGARHVVVDPARHIVPVSASLLFADPMACFEHVLPAARPHVVRRVCISGPGGSGKTSLIQRLATHYNTVWVPEYARTLNESTASPLQAEDIALVLDAQLNAEDAAAGLASRVLFCDTGPAQLAAWTSAALGVAPAWLCAEVTRKRYDLELVASNTSDPSAAGITEQVRAWLTDEVMLPSTPQARFRKAVAAVDEMLTGTGFLSSWGRSALSRLAPPPAA